MEIRSIFAILIIEISGFVQRQFEQVMLCVSWNFEGSLCLSQTVLLYALSFMINNHSEYMMLRKFADIDQFKMDSYSIIILHPTIAKCKFEGLEVLPEPASNPTLASPDYPLFWAMAHFLHGYRFSNVDEVENRCRKFLSLNQPNCIRMEMICSHKDGNRI